MISYFCLVMDDPLLINNPSFGLVQDKLMTFTESKDDLTDKIDLSQGVSSEVNIGATQQV